MPYTHIIKFHEANQRLDHFVRNFVSLGKESPVSRAETTLAIKQGVVLVNKKPTKASYVLKTGDTILFTKEIVKQSIQLESNASLHIPVLYENSDFIIIDKPAGIAMHPASTKDTSTVVNWLLAYLPAIARIGEDPLRPGIVHRLDKDTTGLCIIAKTQDAFIELKHMFQERTIHKTYTALVHGHLQSPTGKIDAAIGRSLRLHKQVVVDKNLTVKGKIRGAVTAYAVIKTFTEHSLLEISPITGRMHQIRVHMTSLGHPIAGDMMYGNKISKKIDQEGLIPLHRHLLHAHQLQFTYHNEEFNFASPLPEDFQTYLVSLKTIE